MMEESRRKLAVFVGECTATVNAPELQGIWAAYAEVSYGSKTQRTPVVQGIARARSRRFGFKSPTSAKKRGASTELKFNWGDWFCTFKDWSQHSPLRIAVFMRNRRESEIIVIRTYVSLNNVKTTKVSQQRSLSAADNGARGVIRIGTAAMLSSELPSHPIGAEEGWFSPTEGDLEISGDESEEDSNDDSDNRGDGTNERMRIKVSKGPEEGFGEMNRVTDQVLQKVVAQIRKNFVESGWKSLLTGPLDVGDQRTVTFSRKQLQGIFRNVGVHATRREWLVLLTYFDPEDTNRVPFLQVKRFMDQVESSHKRRLKSRNIHAKDEQEDSDVLEEVRSMASLRRRKIPSHRCAYAPGDQVEARFLGGEQYVAGVVERIRKRGRALEIRFQDGSYENYVPVDRVRMKKQDDTKDSSLENMARFHASDEDQEDVSLDDEDLHELLNSLPRLAKAVLELIRKAVHRQQRRSLRSGGHFSLDALLEEFADIPSRPDRISRESFFIALKEIGVSLPIDNFENLCDVLDKSSSGSLDYRLLIRLVELGSGTVSGANVHPDVDGVLLRLRKAARSARQKGINAVDVFRMFDKDASSLLDRKNFVKACELLGCVLTPLQAANVETRLRILVPNMPQGRVDYMELLKLIKETAKARAAQHPFANAINAIDCDEAVKRVREQLHQQAEIRHESPDVCKPFERMDSTGEGRVTFLQFTAGLRQLGLIVPMEDIRAVAQKCSWHKDPLQNGSHQGSVDYRKFEQLMCTDEAIAAGLRPQLERAASRGLNAWSVFRSLDPRETGLVSRVDFRKALLTVLGLRMREVHLRRLMDKFSVSCATQDDGDEKTNKVGNRIQFARFLDFVDPKGHAGNLADDVSGLEAKIRHSIRCAAIAYEGSGGSLNLERVFHLFDKHGRSYCSQQDFLNGLGKLGIRLSDKERKILLAKFDPRANGRVDYASFVKYAGFSELEMDQIALRMLQRLRQVVTEGVDFRFVFEVLDVSRSGFLSRREFREAVRNLGLPLTEAELEALMNRFAQFDNRDQIQYQDFLRFVLARENRSSLRAEADDLQVKDRIRRQRLQRANQSRRKKKKRNQKDADSSSSSDGEHGDFRMTINGNGYDGLKLGGDLRPLSFLKQKVLATHDDDVVNDPEVNAWLEAGASEKQRKEFRKIERAVADFAQEKGLSHAKTNAAITSQHAPEMFFDHLARSVNRVVDHSSASRISQKAQERYLATRRHPADNVLEPATHSQQGCSQIALYSVEKDWRDQWYDTPMPVEDDALRGVIFDTFYGKKGRARARKRSKGKRRGSKKRKDDDSESGSDSEGDADWHDDESDSSTCSDRKKRNSKNRSRKKKSKRTKSQRRSRKSSSDTSSDDAEEKSNDSSSSSSSSTSTSYRRKRTSTRRRKSKRRFDESDDSSESGREDKARTRSRRLSPSRWSDDNYDPIAADPSFRRRSKK